MEKCVWCSNIQEIQITTIEHIRQNSSIINYLIGPIYYFHYNI